MAKRMQHLCKIFSIFIFIEIINNLKLLFYEDKVKKVLLFA